MIIDGACEVFPIGQKPETPSELAARVAAIDRDDPKLTGLIRNVIDIMERAKAEDSPEAATHGV